MKYILFGAIFIGMSAGVARAEPPEVSWEWFKAAEIHHGGKLPGGPDIRLTLHYFRLAADKGNPMAAYKLGEIYENGEGVARDPGQALSWYRKAAAAKDKYGQFKVGWCYQKGIGGKADPEMAMRWYRIAAENGNAWGYHMLAFMFADGDGVKRDARSARRYFELSLPKTKDHWAKWKFAMLIEKEDPKRARTLLKEAAAAGNDEAAEELKRIRS